MLIYRLFIEVIELFIPELSTYRIFHQQPKLTLFTGPLVFEVVKCGLNPYKSNDQ